MRPPPQLLPAPEAARSSTALQMGPLKHFFAQLSTLAASKGELSALAKEERAAGVREEKEARQRRTLKCAAELAELVRTPPRSQLFARLCSIRSDSRDVV